MIPLRHFFGSSSRGKTRKLATLAAPVLTATLLLSACGAGNTTHAYRKHERHADRWTRGNVDSGRLQVGRRLDRRHAVYRSEGRQQPTAPITTATRWISRAQMAKLMGVTAAADADQLVRLAEGPGFAAVRLLHERAGDHVGQHPVWREVQHSLLCLHAVHRGVEVEHNHQQLR